MDGILHAGSMDINIVALVSCSNPNGLQLSLDCFAYCLGQIVYMLKERNAAFHRGIHIASC